MGVKPCLGVKPCRFVPKRGELSTNSGEPTPGLAVCGLAGSLSRVTKLAEAGVSHMRDAKLVLRRP